MLLCSHHLSKTNETTSIISIRLTFLGQNHGNKEKPFPLNKGQTLTTCTVEVFGLSLK